MPQPAPNPGLDLNWRFTVKIVLIVVVAMGLMSWSSWAYERFLPSPEVLWLKLLLSACAVAAAICTFIVMQRGFDLRSPPRLLGSRDTASLSAIYAVLTLVFLYVFLPGLLPLLHRFAPSQPVVLIEPVQMDAGSARGCRKHASFPGDSLWMRRRLCKLDPASYGALAKTGRIEIAGSASYFGIAVSQFKAAPAVEDRDGHNP